MDDTGTQSIYQQTDHKDRVDQFEEDKAKRQESFKDLTMMTMKFKKQNPQ